MDKMTVQYGAALTVWKGAAEMVIGTDVALVALKVAGRVDSTAN